MKVAYMRVSTVDQNEDRQREALSDCEKFFIDKISGKTKDRPQLTELLSFVREGDHVYVSSIDRLARSITHANELVNALKDKGVHITFIKENLHFANGDTNPMNELLFNMLASFAQFERSLINERCAEGRAVAKAAGKHMGRRSILNDEQKAQVVERVLNGDKISHIAKSFSVSRATVHNIVRAAK